MKVNKKIISDLLSQRPKDGWTVHDLLKALEVDKSQKKNLKKVLKKLTQKNICFKHRNRYLIKKELDLPHRKSRSLNQNEGENRGRKNSAGNVGFLYFNEKKTFLYDYREGELFSLPFEARRDFIHGDEVIFEPIKGKSCDKGVILKDLFRRRIKAVAGELRVTSLICSFLPTESAYFKEFQIPAKKRGFPKQQGKYLATIPDSTLGTPIHKKRINPLVSLDIKERQAWENPLHKYKVPLQFSKSLLALESQFPKKIDDTLEAGRKDLRSIPFITIDGSDAKDFDDAVFVEVKDQGYILWVAIADVADYVRSGNDLDIEAYQRANSYYLADKVFPMLPEFLSNELCSLRVGENRKVLTCKIEINQSGEKESFEVFESLICVKHRLTYERVDEILQAQERDKQIEKNPLHDLLDLCMGLSQVLIAKRRQRGMIDFSFPESQFVLDELRQIRGIKKTMQSDAMRLIEQFMLETNECIGEFCNYHRIPIIWRYHQKPAKEKSEEMLRQFKHLKIPITRLTSSLDYQKALTVLKTNENRESLEYGLLRSMSFAVYHDQKGTHFGLAATAYCHFTSPIRRYADLLVHRGIKSFLLEKKRIPIKNLVADHLSQREHDATKSGREAVKIRKNYWMASQIGKVFAAKVNGLHWRGIFVEIDDPFVEGFLSYESILDDKYFYHEDKNRTIGRLRKREILIGNPLNVILCALNDKKSSLEFAWLSWDNRFLKQLTLVQDSKNL